MRAADRGVVEREGRFVYEAYFEGEDRAWGSDLGRVRFGRASLHDLRSVTKSVVSTLVGIAIDRGLIASVDVPLRELLPGHAHLLEGEKRTIRLRDVLTMSAGLAWDEWSVPYSDPANDERRLYESEDPIAFVLGRPLVDEPGARFGAAAPGPRPGEARLGLPRRRPLGRGADRLRGMGGRGHSGPPPGRA